MKTTVSEKGQITIPKAIRERLGIVPGSVLDVDASDGRLIATKTEELDVIAKWRGKGRLPGAESVDHYLEKSRE